MKSRFNIPRVILTIILALVSPILPYGLVAGTTLNLNDKIIWSVAFGLIILAAVITIWNQLLNRLIEIELNEQTLDFKNVLTRQVRSISISDIKNIKSFKWTDRVDFETLQKKISVNREYYYNWNELIEKLKTMPHNG